jgi:hypothetical protein
VNALQCAQVSPPLRPGFSLVVFTEYFHFPLLMVISPVLYSHMLFALGQTNKHVITTLVLGWGFILDVHLDEMKVIRYVNFSPSFEIMLIN